MHRTIGGLALAGLFLLCGCDSPHRVAEIESLRKQVKEQQVIVNDLENMLEEGDAKFTEITRKNQDLEQKLRDAKADLDDANRKTQLEILALKVALEKATGKPIEETPAPDKPEAKPADEKKPEEKKPEEKPVDEKKPQEKKPEEKNPDEKPAEAKESP